jgi:ribonuclease R
MIAANVAAADALSRADIPAMYRVHEPPDVAKITALKEMLKASGYRFAAGNRIVAAMFNGLLAQAEAKGENQAIHTAVLRSQMQASYRPKNQGHFGLSLKSYCHFTSPIRRYSDLLVHRALITLHRFHDYETDGIAADSLEKLDVTAVHISQTERRSMLAERGAMDRYVTAYMAQHVGAVFDAHVSSVTNAGLFLSLDDNGADGFIPKGAITDDFYIYDQKTLQLYGKRSKRSFRMGQKIRVRLDVADTITGSLRFAPEDIAPQQRGGTRMSFTGKNKGKPKKRY